MSKCARKTKKVPDCVPETVEDINDTVPHQEGGGNRESPPNINEVFENIVEEVDDKCAKKHYIFTFNNYTEENIPILEKKLEELCSKYCFKKEVGKQGTPHLQGYVELKAKKRISTLVKAIGMKIWFKRSDYHQQAIQYVCKKDTSVDTIIYQMGFDDKLTIVEEQVPDAIVNLRPWQQELKDFTKTKPDDRTITWYYSKDFSIGKTSFIKHMLTYEKGWVYNSGGRLADLACMLNECFKKDKHGYYLNFKGILINIPAGARFNYDILEHIKDGMIFSPKYESSYALFNAVHLIIFSNDKPDFNNATAAAMDPNRWRIFKYDKVSDTFVKKNFKPVADR